MEPLAVVPLACFAAGYFVVGGAELGMGMLLPLLGGNATERAALRRATAPLARLAELWLLATASALLASFPSAVGELTGLLPAFCAVLCGLAPRWLRRGGDWPLVAGSWLSTAGWGWLLASLVVGAEDGPAGPAITLLSVVCVALLLLAHGAGFAALRATGTPFRRARQLVGPRGAGPSVALTSATVAALPLLAGSQLPLDGRAAPPGVLAAVVPALFLGLLALSAAQLRLWRAGA